MSDNPIDGFFIMIAIGVAFWGAIELYAGKVYFLPSTRSPGMSFTRDDDGAVFWAAALAKIGGAFYLIARVYGI